MMICLHKARFVVLLILLGISLRVLSRIHLFLLLLEIALPRVLPVQRLANIGYLEVIRCVFSLLYENPAAKGRAWVTLMEAQSKNQWAILRQGKVMALSKEIMAQIKASPTMIWGWYDQDEMVAWSHIFPLTPVSQRLRTLPLSDLAWVEWTNPW